MSIADTSTRNELERAVVRARELAEQAVAKALRALAVEAREPRAAMTAEERRLRVQLRAVGRRLGGHADLAQACAYEHWHRMLFARFLAENGLLLHPEHRVPVTLEECAELGRESGEPDRWMVAARFAAHMLPGIFPQDDPLLQVRLAPEDRLRLEQLVEGLSQEVFTSDDGLGWTYQFWQTKRKKEVNASGLPMKGADLAAVTQHFTEHYMVQFLLQNTLGAWWLSLHPDSPLKGGWAYYRPEVEHDFSAWPQTAAEVRIIDPCCGSGHFLVEAFAMLLGMHREEGRAATEAVELILGENLYGLEIDARCVQIAAFALALSAWKVGYPLDRELSVPNVACSGLPLGASEDEWRALANGDTDLDHALVSLHGAFANAGEIGSLLDLSETTQTLPFADTQVVLDHLTRALRRERNMADPVAGVFGSFVNGGLRALETLRGKYHLAVTNPPFLLRDKQKDVLRAFCASKFSDARNDLATCFLSRCLAFVPPGGCASLVVPQGWLSLDTYEPLRVRLLKAQRWLFAMRLGPHAFETITGEVVKVCLLGISRSPTSVDSRFLGIDLSEEPEPSTKARRLAGPALQLRQATQLEHPDARVLLSDLKFTGRARLGDYVDFGKGSVSGDRAHYLRKFWEVGAPLSGIWRRWLDTPAATHPWQGREHVALWDVGGSNPEAERGAWIRGQRVWGKKGVAIGKINRAACTLYDGTVFDDNIAVLCPHDEDHLPPLWAYCTSEDFRTALQTLDPKLNVTIGTFVKVPFDLAHWQAVAEKAGPLPQPHSEDPTQWLFKGNVKGSEAPLQVAVARLLGYRWPEQPERDELSGLADPDGIVCLPAVLGESPGVDRLREVLRAACGDEWELHTEQDLLGQVGHGGKTLEAWLRDGFFGQHAKLFHNRPFIWHIWDGRRDGFCVLAGYHSLDRAKLEKLTYSYLGEWISRQQAGARDGTPGAEARLVAAQDLRRKLELILEGEPPYDIYVRWKPLDQQPMGWEPDLDDGVRLNIRPFVAAGVLRSRFTVNWKKDRGRNPDGAERINDLHITLEQKRKAREKAG
jgi:hypothetical protein